MTVKNLIKKLQKMPQGAIVTISNDRNYLDGEYEVTSIEQYDYQDTCSIVEICTDYFYKM